MIDTYLRHTYQTIAVDPVLKVAVKKNISANMLTLAGLAIGLGIIPSLSFGWNGLALALLAFSGYLDTLDGSLARASGSTSHKGAVLDIVSDRIVEFGVVLGLYLADPASRGLICILMLGSILICVSSFLVVGIFSENHSTKSFHYSPGIMERTEAFIFFALMFVFPTYLDYLGITFTILVTLTGLIRVWQFRKHP